MVNKICWTAIKNVHNQVWGSLKSYITFEDYEQILREKEIMCTPMRLIQSKHHKLFSSEMNKISLSPFDDKRVILDNRQTLAHGHYKWK